MLADELDFVVGVDPHRDLHATGVVEVRSGVVVFASSVTADSGGFAEAVRVAERHAPGRRAFAVEGTGPFGAVWGAKNPVLPPSRLDPGM
jgi:hypothetical protein